MGFSGYERTSKRTTCQKLAFQGKLAQLGFDDSNYTNPSKFDSVHNIRNRIKFRRICVESSEQNGIRIFETICPIMLLFGQKGLSDVVLSKYPNKSHNFQNYIFYDVIALEHYVAKMVVNKSGLYRLNLWLVRKLARHFPSRPSTH